ncbi:MAG: AgmX/PglI C-terminal domain-containing protein [Polyangiales bacterium]
MAQGSSLPPLKTNKSKYGVVLLVLLGTCGGGWLYMQRAQEAEEATQAAEQPMAAPEPGREQFVPEIEIPEEEELEAVAAPSDGATPRPKPSTPRESVACDGLLEANQIRDVINGAPSKQVRTCYEQRLKDNNLLQGQMKVLLTIAQNGGVRNVSVSGSLRDAQVYSCVKRVARSWKFPRPTGGCVRTAVPFTLTPKL